MRALTKKGNQLLKTCITLLSFSQMASSKKQFYPAADRNKQPILDILKDHISLSDKRKCLEISSGSGQHVSFFAPHFPNVRFYPSEESRFLFDSINEHVKSDGLGNVEQARYIDASSPPETWYDGKLQKETLDYVYNCNMIHLVPFSTTEGKQKSSPLYI
ncbi:methyltransferase-like 26, partial [Diaphorina citri]|uniref:Methyltransferase-like 26 n=1 Tax=Diaphorina citri TaxID=121845 RepID=A0A3Q0JBQ6_DIACI